MVDTCLNCYYMKKMPGVSGGRCMRHPPVVLYVTSEHGVSNCLSETPWVSDDDWCGELSPKLRKLKEP